VCVCVCVCVCGVIEKRPVLPLSVVEWALYKSSLLLLLLLLLFVRLCTCVRGCDYVTSRVWVSLTFS